MSVIKTRKKSSEFTTIHNKPLQDYDLSFEAKGMLAYLVSRPDGWRISTKDLQNMRKPGPKGGKTGEHKVRRILKELEAAGYAILLKNRSKNGTISGSEWVVSDDQEIIKKEKSNRGYRKYNLGHTEVTENRNSENTELGENGTYIKKEEDIKKESLKRAASEADATDTAEIKESIPPLHDTHSSLKDPSGVKGIAPNDVQTSIKASEPIGESTYDFIFKHFNIRPSAEMEVLLMKLTDTDLEHIKKHLPILAKQEEGRMPKFRKKLRSYLREKIWITEMPAQGWGNPERKILSVVHTEDKSLLPTYYKGR